MKVSKNLKKPRKIESEVYTINFYMIYSNYPVTKADDVSFIYSDKKIGEIYRMIDIDKWQVEQIYVPKNEAAYVAYPEWLGDVSDLSVISVPDEVFDHEEWVARYLSGDKRLISYIHRKNEYGMYGVFFNAENHFRDMVDFFRERPDYLVKYYDYISRKNKKKADKLFEPDFYCYCVKQLLKRKDWHVIDVRKIS
ncbi:hypothetical protein M3651_20890 [Cytobacillus oceanisediminis]|nr:hypothetical protein [Cytobacillus oceanisediminis]